MTVDKETLIKHRFWIALGVFGLLWLVGLILIPTVQGSNNAEVEKKFSDANTQINGVKDPKNENFVNPLKGKEGILKDKKGDVWGIAWEFQKNMCTWPEGGNAKLDERLNEARFGAYIKDSDCSEYGNKLYDKYLTGLNFPDMIKPVEYQGGWTNIVRPVSHWPIDPPPTPEECWLAQEDLWVKRELLEIIQKTLDDVRIFKVVEADKDTDKSAKAEKAPEGVKRKLMRNSNWELELVTEPDEKSKETVISAKTKIKNINAWKRNLSLADVKFRVKQGAGDNFMEFAIPVDNLNWGETTDIKRAFAFGKLVIDPSKPLEVEQVLSWSTSPIKRIDALALGYNSHRTANRPCKAKPIGNQKPASEDANKTGSESMMPMGVPPGSSYGPGSGSMMGPGSDSMRPDAGKGGGKGLNKDLKRERYLDFTDQVRWMPIGMVLIVDQAYMQDLQTQVVNSRLRIQPTQISFHRAYGIRPSADNDKTDKKDKGDKPSTGDTEGRPTTGPGGYGSMMMRGKPMFQGGGAYGPSGPTGGFPMIPGGGSVPGFGPSSAASVEEDPNLVELSIYGIASLYERPPKQTPPAEKKP
jgi:hypothetical protein